MARIDELVQEREHSSAAGRWYAGILKPAYRPPTNKRQAINTIGCHLLAALCEQGLVTPPEGLQEWAADMGYTVGDGGDFSHNAAFGLLAVALMDADDDIKSRVQAAVEKASEVLFGDK